MESSIQKNIQHVILLMLENRSFDNLMGWLYESKQPNHFLPGNTPESLMRFNGLDGKSYSNPLDLDNPATAIKSSKGIENYRVPNPDPNEDFKYMNRQLFGLDIDKNTDGWLPKTEGVQANMQGFLADYVTAKCSSRKVAPQIMQTFSPDEVAVMSGLAKKYAVSDNYHASCPTQTWPNRAFMHAGTSAGKVNNFPYLPYTNKTIFNVFEENNHSWKVYKSSKILPSLTRIQMTQLWSPKLDGHFHHVDQFIEDCKTGSLPAYSFIEPSFVIEKGANATSEHPPANVCAGDHFLQTLCNAVINSPAFAKTLFIINFDEHGGCPDHVPPNWTAVPPDKQSQPGQLGFNFNRYGVRVPAIFVSPYIPESTCIRATDDPWNASSQPYDHTSILAMLLDWKEIDRSQLPSERVLKAMQHPFDDLLSGECRSDRPQFMPQCRVSKQSFWLRLINFIKNLFGFCADGYALSSLQKSIIIADAYHQTAKASGFVEEAYVGQIDTDELLRNIKTESDMLAYFQMKMH